MTNNTAQDFNLFLKAIGLCPQGQYLVAFYEPQDTYGVLSGTLIGSVKEVKKILENQLKQKAKRKETSFNDMWSFEIKNKGWIVIEQYSQDAYLTLVNKWW